jgi:DNA polymerase I
MSSTMAGPVLLLDAFSLFYRAFHALPAMSTTTGEPTSAVYGFSALLLKLFREQRPVGAAFALDLPEPTFRHRQYSAYKATRGDAPGPLGDQFSRFLELITALGVPAFAASGFEADDVLATLARELTELGEQPLVVTGDYDCVQIARPPARVMIVSRGTAKAEIYDEDAIRRVFGVERTELCDYSALVGDPSDNIPGVPSVGPRTAASLIARFGSVAGILARLDEVTPPRTRAAIAAAASELPMYVTLARLRDDVPLPAGPRYAPVTLEARQRLTRLFEELEFRSLLGRMNEALG